MPCHVAPPHTQPQSAELAFASCVASCHCCTLPCVAANLTSCWGRRLIPVRPAVLCGCRDACQPLLSEGGPHCAGSAVHSSPLQPCMPCAFLSHPTTLKQQRWHIRGLALNVQAVLDEMGCQLREYAWPDHWYFGRDRRLVDSRYEVHSSRASWCGPVQLSAAFTCAEGLAANA